MGCEVGLDAAGIPAASRMVIDGDGPIESGRLAVDQLFLRDTPPTAMICVNDQTTFGVMPGRRGRGYVLQCYFSVTGFDDVPQAALIPSRSDPPAKGLDRQARDDPAAATFVRHPTG